MSQLAQPRADEVGAALLRVVEQVAGKGNGFVPLHEPEFGGNEKEYLAECIDSTFVSSVGKFVDRFEEMLAEYTGAKHAVAVVNGTSALQMALHLAGVGAGDEVVVPALSFVATANAVKHAGGVPHFVDSDARTLGMSPGALAERLAEVARREGEGVANRVTGRRIAAVVPMHTFGHPVAMEPLLAVAERYGLPVVEDAAESLGSTLGGRHMGTFGQVAWQAPTFNAWREQIAQFYRELTEGAPRVVASIDDGIDALRVSLAVLQSVAEKRTVHLSEEIERMPVIREEAIG